MTVSELRPANPYDRVNVRWGQGSRMTSIEAAMWRASADPRLRAASVVVEVLDRVPDWERLLAGHRFGLARIPRMRQRVVDDPLRLGPPAWCDTHVDLDHHLSRVQLDDGTLEDAFAVAARIHTTDFDLARPLWQGVLIEGLADGRAVYLLKLHHALADGPAVMELFDLVHSARREPTAGKPMVPQGAQDDRRPLGLSARHAVGLVQRAPLVAARAVGGTVGAVARPRRTLSVAHTTARAVDRFVSGAPGAPSPLLRRRGTARHFTVVDVPSVDLRAAADATGGSLGDVFMAALLGGLARYHAACGVPLADVPTAIPTGVRLAGATMSRLTRARIAGPAGILDPAQRVAVAGDRARAVRETPPTDVLRATAAVISRAPAPVLGRVAGGFTQACDLQLFTFRGLDRDAYVAGAKVERMAILGPTSGSAVTATFTSHGPWCSIGLTTDSAAVDEPEILRDAVQAAVDELLALAR